MSYFSQNLLAKHHLELGIEELFASRHESAIEDGQSATHLDHQRSEDTSDVLASSVPVRKDTL